MINLVVIIARAGSKGLPNKAMVKVGGKELVAWTIEHALASKLATGVALTSDGEDIRAVGQRYGISTFDRPDALSSDSATVDSPVRDAVIRWEKERNLTCDHVVILYGNVPLRPMDLVDRALEKIASTKCHSVQSVFPVGKMHPYWMKKLAPGSGPGNGSEPDVLMMYQENNVYRRQDLPPVYMLDGGLIAVTRKNLFDFDPTGKAPHQFLGTDRRAVVTNAGDVIDVDDALDLAFAEAVLKTRGMKV